MIYRTLFMALVMPLAAAEDIVDPIALWAFGSGTRSDQPCSEGAVERGLDGADGAASR